MAPDIKLPSVKLPVEPLLKVLPEHFVNQIGKKRLQEWIDRGLPFDMADKLAVKWGYHPAEIWGELWFTSEIHEDIYNAGVSIVRVVKEAGSIDLKTLLSESKVSGNYVRSVIEWVEKLGCIRIELKKPENRKIFHFEKDFDY